MAVGIKLKIWEAGIGYSATVLETDAIGNRLVEFHGSRDEEWIEEWRINQALRVLRASNINDAAEQQYRLKHESTKRRVVIDPIPLGETYWTVPEWLAGERSEPPQAMNLVQQHGKWVSVDKYEDASVRSWKRAVDVEERERSAVVARASALDCMHEPSDARLCAQWLRACAIQGQHMPDPDDEGNDGLSVVDWVRYQKWLLSASAT